jgi:hypothetical protein
MIGVGLAIPTIIFAWWFGPVMLALLSMIVATLIYAAKYYPVAVCGLVIIITIWILTS